MNLSSAKISIIIPNYNRGNLLPETLDSVLRQDYPHWEALVVDDGSSDNSLAVGQEYASKDKRIQFFSRDREPAGAPACRNIGLNKSTGDFVIFLDSDDLLADFCLSQRIKVINQHPENDFWVFPMWVFSNDINHVRHVWNIETPQSDLSRFLSLDAVWQTSGPIWRTESVKKIGGFTEGLACWQDVDIHLKALENHLTYQKYYMLPPDMYYRQHISGSISQGEISSLPKLRTRLDILTNHFRNIREKNDEIMQGFNIMAASIAIGSARTLHQQITREVLVFGRNNGLFDADFIRKTKMIQALVLSRLNRIGLINRFILKRIKKYRRDSNIGHHPPQKLPNDTRKHTHNAPDLHHHPD